MLAPLLDTQPLAQFNPMIPTALWFHMSVLVPIKRIAVSPLAFHAEQREPSRSLMQSHRQFH